MLRLDNLNVIRDLNTLFKMMDDFHCTKSYSFVLSASLRQQKYVENFSMLTVWMVPILTLLVDQSLLLGSVLRKVSTPTRLTKLNFVTRLCTVANRTTKAPECMSRVSADLLSIEELVEETNCISRACLKIGCIVK